MNKSVVLFVPDRLDDVYGNRFLTLDPNVTGVFSGAYPFGIDPVSKFIVKDEFSFHAENVSIVRCLSSVWIQSLFKASPSYY